MQIKTSNNNRSTLCSQSSQLHFSDPFTYAITDSPGQGSDWLTTNNAGLALYLIIVIVPDHRFPFDAMASWSQLGGWGEAPLIGFAALRSCTDHAVRLS